MKIICYFVSNADAPYFDELNKYGYELTIVKKKLGPETVDMAQGHDGVLIHGSCDASKEIVDKLASYGVKYLFTRSAGFNHIDLDACKEHGIRVATGSGYSPNSVTELCLTMALSLLRNVTFANDRISRLLNMRYDKRMSSREVRNCTVGIIGTGNIGRTMGQAYKGLGSKVLGYSRSKTSGSDDVFEYVDLDTLLAKSDIVSVHIPYTPGVNDELINADFIAKMKDNSILINGSRGALQNNQAIVDGIKSEKLYGYGTDVLPDEMSIFGKIYKHTDEISDPTVREMVELYPRILITPHVGAQTDQASKDMISISFENFNDILNGREPKNLLV